MTPAISSSPGGGMVQWLCKVLCHNFSAGFNSPNESKMVENTSPNTNAWDPKWQGKSSKFVLDSALEKILNPWLEFSWLADGVPDGDVTWMGSKARSTWQCGTHRPISFNWSLKWWYVSMLYQKKAIRQAQSRPFSSILSQTSKYQGSFQAEQTEVSHLDEDRWGGVQGAESRAGAHRPPAVEFGQNGKSWDVWKGTKNL